MTDKPTPTDAELDALRQADNGELNFVTLRQFRVIARAALAKWGTPQAVAGEPVAWRLRDEEASSTYRKDVYVYYDRADFKENINPIEICDGLECLYSPSQITQTCVIEAAVRKQDDALIRQLVEALDECKDSTQERIDTLTESGIDKHKPRYFRSYVQDLQRATDAISAARARLGCKHD